MNQIKRQFLSLFPTLFLTLCIGACQPPLPEEEPALSSAPKEEAISSTQQAIRGAGLVCPTNRFACSETCARSSCARCCPEDQVCHTECNPSGYASCECKSN